MCGYINTLLTGNRYGRINAFQELVGERRGLELIATSRRISEEAEKYKCKLDDIVPCVSMH